MSARMDAARHVNSPHDEEAGTAPLELMVVGIARDMRTKDAFAAVAANAN